MAVQRAARALSAAQRKAMFAAIAARGGKVSRKSLVRQKALGRIRELFGKDADKRIILFHGTDRTAALRIRKHGLAQTGASVETGKQGLVFLTPDPSHAAHYSLRTRALAATKGKSAKGKGSIFAVAVKPSELKKATREIWRASPEVRELALKQAREAVELKVPGIDPKAVSRAEKLKSSLTIIQMRARPSREFVAQSNIGKQFVRELRLSRKDLRALGGSHISGRQITRLGKGFEEKSAVAKIRKLSLERDTIDALRVVLSNKPPSPARDRALIKLTERIGKIRKRINDLRMKLG